MKRILPILLLCLFAGGCVQRTITVTSQPEGALVYLNDEEVGRTPVTVPFTFYGTYDVRLEAPGHEPLWTKQKAEAPFWETPGLDLIAEAVPNGKAELEWHFDMMPKQAIEEVNPDELVERAGQLKARLDEE